MKKSNLPWAFKEVTQAGTVDGKKKTTDYLKLLLPMPAGTDGPHDSCYTNSNSDRSYYDVP